MEKFTNATISTICGENVCVKDEGLAVEWCHVYSGGCVFSATPMKRNQEYRIRLFDGSSHIDVGYTQKDPYTCQNVRVAHFEKHFKEVGNIRLHRKELVVIVAIEEDSFVCRSPDNIRSTISPGAVWIYVNIKFGEAKIRLETDKSQSLKFHDICGENISRQGAEDIAKLSKEFPSSICCLQNSLSVGDEIKFELKPDTSGPSSEPPHYYHVAFGVCSLSPLDLRVKAPEIFSVSNNATSVKSQQSRSHIGIIEVFERRGKSKACDGVLTVTRIDESRIKYKHSSSSGSGVEKTIKSPAYLIFEPFRACVTIVEDNSSCGYSAVTAGKDADAGNSKPEPQTGKTPEESSWDSSNGGSSNNKLS
ncbi:uncharacterized protein LOC132565126 [Ylistrum balloti]|uniref:uncharacterized protein LOC132565126 n=1 Tax=Ylistrum balloti TaxID=509963 RepID=UPI002905D9C9|nr:uncharacterized protein LOC132565126 [Ylistrum balloti]